MLFSYQVFRICCAFYTQASFHAPVCLGTGSVSPESVPQPGETAGDIKCAAVESLRQEKKMHLEFWQVSVENRKLSLLCNGFQIIVWNQLFQCREITDTFVGTDVLCICYIMLSSEGLRGPSVAFVGCKPGHQLLWTSPTHKHAPKSPDAEMQVLGSGVCTRE